MTQTQEQQAYRKAFGEKLKAARAAAGMPRSELASRLGIGPTQISRWEGGHVLPHLQRVAQIAQALGCELSALAPDPNPAGTEDSPDGQGKTATH